MSQIPFIKGPPSPLSSSGRRASDTRWGRTDPHPLRWTGVLQPGGQRHRPHLGSLSSYGAGQRGLLASRAPVRQVVVGLGDEDQERRLEASETLQGAVGPPVPDHLPAARSPSTSQGPGRGRRGPASPAASGAPAVLHPRQAPWPRGAHHCASDLSIERADGPQTWPRPNMLSRGVF